MSAHNRRGHSHVHFKGMCFTSITPHIGAGAKVSCLTHVDYCWTACKGYAQVPALNVSMHISQSVQTTQSLQIALNHPFAERACEISIVVSDDTKITVDVDVAHILIAR